MNIRFPKHFEYRVSGEEKWRGIARKDFTFVITKCVGGYDAKEPGGSYDIYMTDNNTLLEIRRYNEDRRWKKPGRE